MHQDTVLSPNFPCQQRIADAQNLILTALESNNNVRMFTSHQKLNDLVKIINIMQTF